MLDRLCCSLQVLQKAIATRDKQISVLGHASTTSINEQQQTQLPLAVDAHQQQQPGGEAGHSAPAAAVAAAVQEQQNLPCQLVGNDDARLLRGLPLPRRSSCGGQEGGGNVIEFVDMLKEVHPAFMRKCESAQVPFVATHWRSFVSKVRGWHPK